MYNRYLIVIIGSSRGIDESLNNIAESEYGVNYVDGNGIFIATFYSHYSVNDLYDLLIDWQAILIFDITEPDKYGVNLPSKYYKGLFPELEDIIPTIKNDKTETIKKPKKIEDLTDVNEILDKLQINNYNIECLTDGEKNILNNYNNIKYILVYKIIIL